MQSICKKFFLQRRSDALKIMWNYQYAKIRIILHIWTNDLNSDKLSEPIVKYVADVRLGLKNESCDASISNSTVRNDKFKEKAAEVNKHLARLSKKRKIYSINRVKNIIPHHLNKSRLHLNKKGSSILSADFVKVLHDIFNWRIETSDRFYFIKSGRLRMFYLTG